jgi:hypothetical protein
VFSHSNGEQKLAGDDLGNKLKRIRQMRLAGSEDKALLTSVNVGATEVSLYEATR